MDEVQPEESDAVPTSESLTIEVGGALHTVHRDDGAVTIGRDRPSQILLSEPGVSRTHVRIQYDADHWSLTDTDSRNGTFVDGERVVHAVVEAAMTMHLGDPHGIAIRLDPQPPDRASLSDEGTPAVTSEESPATGATRVALESTARAGAAVTARREELGLSPNTLTEGVMALDDYARFESGDLWPDSAVRAILEQRLMWSDGVIERIREGADVPDEEVTDLLSPTVQVAVAIDAAEVEVRGIHARIRQLSDTGDQRFMREVTPLLTQLRRLDRLCTAAVRKAPGRLEVAVALAAIRHVRAELVIHAAGSPRASLGQRLAAARHRGRMSIAEVATAAGVTIADVEAVEREEHPPASAVDALERFVAAVVDRLGLAD